MPVEVIMPMLGMAQETGKVVRWLKAEGEAVAKAEPLMEVETDKVTVEIEAPAAGTLAGVTATEGEDIPVGQVIAYVLGDGEQLPEPDARNAPPAAAVAEAAVSRGQTPGHVGNGEASRRTLASPKARRLAREHGVPIEEITGSGPYGAVQAADVEGFALPRAAPHVGDLARGAAFLPLARGRGDAPERLVRSRPPPSGARGRHAHRPAREGRSRGTRRASARQRRRRRERRHRRRDRRRARRAGRARRRPARAAGARRTPGRSRRARTRGEARARGRQGRHVHDLEPRHVRRRRIRRDRQRSAGCDPGRRANRRPRRRGRRRPRGPADVRAHAVARPPRRRRRSRCALSRDARLADRGAGRAGAVTITLDRLRGPLVALTSLAVGAGIWEWLGTRIPK